MPSSPAPTPYEVLGVAKDADPATIRLAYRRLLRTSHPDAGGTAGMFRMVQAAFDALQSPPPQRTPDASSPAQPRTSSPPSAADREAQERAEAACLRRQAYVNYSNDPWQAEFVARQGEKRFASPLTESELVAALTEMMRRGITGQLYPVPEYWTASPTGATAVAERQAALKQEIRARQQAEIAQRKETALVAREAALATRFRTVEAERRFLLSKQVFQAETARRTSTVRLHKLYPQLRRMRRLPVAASISIPLLWWAGLGINVWLVGFSHTGLGSESFSWVQVVSSAFFWVPGLLAYYFHAPRVELILRRAAAGTPYEGHEADREDWLRYCQQALNPQ